jgi:methylated-DNA-[protein]-cysteine S-methyltransferase
MTLRYDTFSTPCGAFSAAIDDTGALVATAFGSLAKLKERVATHEFVRETSALTPVRRELEEYFAGHRRNFTVRTAAAGTPFQQAVWTALGRIPFGGTATYGALAASISRPGATRAVGRANGANPICVIVPCHRVIGADGSLTGFAFGEKIKRQLLQLEQSR